MEKENAGTFGGLRKQQHQCMEIGRNEGQENKGRFYSSDYFVPLAESAMEGGPRAAKGMGGGLCVQLLACKSRHTGA